MRVSEIAASGGTGRAREALGGWEQPRKFESSTLRSAPQRDYGLTSELFLVLSNCFSGASMTRWNFGAAATV